MGKEALGGFLAGATLMGVFLALFMANAGGAWDNAKKYIEEGQPRRQGLGRAQGGRRRRHGGRSVQGHRGPSMNILIKLMSVVALVLAPLFR